VGLGLEVGSGTRYCERDSINYAEMQNRQNCEHKGNEILPSGIGRRNTYNSRRAMMCGATWNPIMSRLGVSKVLTGVGKAIKLERVNAAKLPK